MTGYPLGTWPATCATRAAPGDLRQLLAAAHPAAGCHTVNVWFAAHDAAECVSVYLDDLTRAQRIAATENQPSPHPPHPSPVPGLGDPLRADDRKHPQPRSQHHPELPALLGSTGQWTPERALDHARRLAPVN